MRPTKEGLYRKTGSAYWYCRFYTPEGELKRISTGETDYDKAESVYKLKRIEADCKPPEQGATVNTVLAIYKQHRGKELRGQVGYNSGQSCILKFLDGVPWADFAAEHHPKNIDAYIEYRIKQCKVKPATVNREIGLLSASANVAIKKGVKIANPCPGHKLPVTKHPYYWLTHEEAAALIQAAKPRAKFKNSDHLHEYCIIALGTGMRMSEILKLTIADISLKHNVIRLPTSKSGEPHEIPMTESVRRVIESRIERSTVLQTPHLFADRKTLKPIQTIITPFKRACQRAGIPVTNKKIGQVGFRVHDTRHTVGSWLVQAGEPLEKVQDLLNHSDLRTTQRYAHHAPDARKSTVAKLPKL